MDKFNKVMWVIYWAVFIVVSVATVLYCTIEKVRSWLNRHVVVPYVKECEKISNELTDIYYGSDETESEEK